ncbi:hypothetical protein HDU91_002840 [Kappamyces sp. JEL0680]|nr:hypothetical protein HDU91_002840 [Kappamyces sp. JEL0680]
MILLLVSLVLAQRLQNGDFESASCPSGQSYCFKNDGGSSIAPWTATSADGFYEVDTSAVFVPASGLVSLDLNAHSPVTLRQTVATNPAQAYIVTFYINENSCGASLKTGTVQALPSGSLQSFSHSVANDAALWRRQDYSFTASSSQTTIVFSSTTSGSCGPLLDAVSMVALSQSTSTHSTSSTSSVGSVSAAPTASAALSSSASTAATSSTVSLSTTEVPLVVSSTAPSDASQQPSSPSSSIPLLAGIGAGVILVVGCIGALMWVRGKPAKEISFSDLERFPTQSTPQESAEPSGSYWLYTST